jgi:hypothetical protein
LTSEVRNEIEAIKLIQSTSTKVEMGTDAGMEAPREVKPLLLVRNLCANVIAGLKEGS